MTRPKPSLHQHLLTRSDLARLQVPAGDVLSWLADGWIEQVGGLPDGTEGAADPVFTVLSNRLRQELALRLVEIGKPTVVLTPLRVRSFLMRALIGTTGSGDAASPEATHAAEQDLADVLREVVAEVEADVEDVLRLATEEAKLEADASSTAMPPVVLVPALSTPPAAATPAAQAQGADEASPLDYAVSEGVEESELEACFDADEVDATLAALAGDAVPADAAAAATPVQLADEPDAVTTDGAGTAGTQESVEATAPVPRQVGEVMEANAADVLDTATPNAIDAACTPASTPPLLDDPTPPREPDITMASDPTSSNAPETADVPDAVEASTTAVRDAVDEPAAPAASLHEARPLPSPTPDAPSPEQTVRDAAEAVLERTVHRVESFLGELQKSLLAIAQRPEPAPLPPPPPAPTAPPIDLGPVVSALQAGFEQSARAGTAVQAAVTTLGERLNGLGERMAAVSEGAAGVGTHIEHGMQALDRTLHELQAVQAQARASQLERVVPGILIGRGDRQATVLIAVAALVIAWSAVFWIRMESPRLAIATLIGANVVACCLLASSRSRA